MGTGPAADMKGNSALVNERLKKITLHRKINPFNMTEKLFPSVVILLLLLISL